MADSLKTPAVTHEDPRLNALILDNAAALILVIDPHGRILRCSRAWETVAGFSEAELRGRSIWDLPHVPELRSREQAAFDQLRAGEPIRYEGPLVRKNGDRRLIEWSATPVRGSDGKVEYLVAVGLDITDRKRTEDELREGRSVLESRVAERTAELTAANLRLIEQIGRRERAEAHLAAEKRVLELVASGAPLRKALEAVCTFLSGPLGHSNIAIQLNGGLEVYCQGAQPDGQALSGAAQPIVGAEAQDLGKLRVGSTQRALTSIERDLIETAARLAAIAIERSRAEGEVRRQRDFAELLIRSSLDGIVAFDLQGRCTLWNPALERMTGITAAEMAKRDVFRTLLPADDPEAPRPLAEIQAGRTAIVPEQPFAIGRTNHRGYFEAYYAPLRDDTGRVTGGLGVIRDVTERKESEDKARRHLDELAYVARVANMGELASGLAHELNQPLCAIVNYTEACLMMLESVPGEHADLKEAMSEVANQAERAGDVIRRLRQFIQVREPTHDRIDINKLIRDVVRHCRPEIEQSRSKVRMDLDPELPALVGDSMQIEQVLLNLVRNGIQEMQECAGGASERLLSISTHTNGDGVEVAVSDCGRGVQDDDVQRVFEPFYSTRLDAMGMGLPISRSIIENHGGRLWLERNEGGGAVFRFRLPFAGKEYHDQVRADRVRCG